MGLKFIYSLAVCAIFYILTPRIAAVSSIETALGFQNMKSSEGLTGDNPKLNEKQDVGKDDKDNRSEILAGRGGLNFLFNPKNDGNGKGLNGTPDGDKENSVKGLNGTARVDKDDKDNRSEILAGRGGLNFLFNENNDGNGKGLNLMDLTSNVV